MAVDDILKRIEADARTEAERIVAERQKEGEAVLDEARRKRDALKEKLGARARQRADEARNRIVTLAKLAARRELLNEKQRLIDRAFDGAREKVLAMSREEYRRLIRGLLERAVEDGENEVIVDTGEDRIDQAFLDDVARNLGESTKLRLSSARRPIGGGFVLRRGRTETNQALDTILRDARERLETEVAAILFGGERDAAER